MTEDEHFSMERKLNNDGIIISGTKNNGWFINGRSGHNEGSIKPGNHQNIAMEKRQIARVL
jgi:hypothetical protein